MEDGATITSLHTKNHKINKVKIYDPLAVDRNSAVTWIKSGSLTGEEVTEATTAVDEDCCHDCLIVNGGERWI